MRIDLASWPGTTSFALLDEDGKELGLFRTRGGERRSFHRGELVDGRSEVLGVSPHARWVVLYDDGQEVARYPVQLSNEGLNTLRY